MSYGHTAISSHTPLLVQSSHVSHVVLTVYTLYLANQVLSWALSPSEFSLGALATAKPSTGS